MIVKLLITVIFAVMTLTQSREVRSSFEKIKRGGDQVGYEQMTKSFGNYMPIVDFKDLGKLTQTLSLEKMFKNLVPVVWPAGSKVIVVNLNKDVNLPFKLPEKPIKILPIVVNIQKAYEKLISLKVIGNTAQPSSEPKPVSSPFRRVFPTSSRPEVIDFTLDSWMTPYTKNITVSRSFSTVVIKTLKPVFGNKLFNISAIFPLMNQSQNAYFLNSNLTENPAVPMLIKYLNIKLNKTISSIKMFFPFPNQKNSTKLANSGSSNVVIPDSVQNVQPVMNNIALSGNFSSNTGVDVNGFDSGTNGSALPSTPSSTPSPSLNSSESPILNAILNSTAISNLDSNTKSSSPNL